MAAMIYILPVAALLIVFGVMLLRGKGAMLIAGYNTASPAERARYDEKKLCRAAGAVCLIVAGMLLLMAALLWQGENLPEGMLGGFLTASAVVLVGTVAWALIYMNTRAKKDWKKKTHRGKE